MYSSTATSTPPPSSRSSPTVSENSWCILDFGDDRRYFCQATRSGANAGVKVTAGKVKIATRTLIGLPYGCVVEVSTQGRRFDRTDDDEIEPAFLDELTALSPAAFSTGGESSTGPAPTVPIQGKGSNDNRDLSDGNTAQGMGHEEIMEMKREGAGGKDVIQALIDNSATFKGKTEFSKAKYIKRKAKK